MRIEEPLGRGTTSSWLLGAGLPLRRRLDNDVGMEITPTQIAVILALTLTLTTSQYFYFKDSVFDEKARIANSHIASNYWGEPNEFGLVREELLPLCVCFGTYQHRDRIFVHLRGRHILRLDECECDDNACQAQFAFYHYDRYRYGYVSLHLAIRAPARR